MPGTKIVTGRLTEAELEQMRRDEAKSSPIPVAPLPPELLRLIIMHATDTHPPPFSIHRSIAFSAWEKFPLPLPDRLDPKMRKKLHVLSMQRKLLISQVSKLWRDITVEFLYNSIRIHHAKQIPLLGIAFYADEQRKKAQGGPSQRLAAWWVREIWMDLDLVSPVYVPGGNPSRGEGFDLPDLFQRCPNVVAFWGFGHRFRWMSQPGLFKRGQIVKSIVTTTFVDGTAACDPPSDLRGPGIEISQLFDYDPFIPLFSPPTGFGRQPNYFFMHHIQSLELHISTGFRNTSHNQSATVCLPDLTHLLIRGLGGSVQYATFLEMPNIRSLTYDAGSIYHPMDQDAFQALMKRHGAKLKELALVQRARQDELLQIQEHCTNLETMYIHWASVSLCPPTVTNVGLFDLENVVYSKSGDQVLTSLTGLLARALALREVKDLSWRSGIIRQRAIRSRNDPAAVTYRKFWADFSMILRRGADVRLVDWRGREVDAGCFVQGVGEDMMDEDDRAIERLATWSI